MIAQLPNLDAILKRHRIHPRFWAEFRAHIEANVQPGDELQACLDHIANYKAALKEAIHAIPCEHTFAPADYQSPVPYESLLLEDIEPPIESEALASAGAPSVAR
jgi:hypothetical protein